MENIQICIYSPRLKIIIKNNKHIDKEIGKKDRWKEILIVSVAFSIGKEKYVL